MSAARYLVGDVFDRMAEIADGSVDLVLTSPPFLALRSYLPADHPDKGKEIGQELTPAEFIDTLLHLTAEWRRVLAPHGSIAVELGDTYSGSGESGWERDTGEFRRENRSARSAAGALQQKRDRRTGWPLTKSLCGIPHLYHLSLAYGRNLLTGEESPAGRWRVRNVVAWVRPNPPVGALGDKFRPATSYMTIACVSAKRYFDLDAVREPVKHPGQTRTRSLSGRSLDRDERSKVDDDSHPAGAPPLDWWEIPTQPYKGSHYATWPEALLTRPIEAMCPHRVCRVCGEPSRRIVEVDYEATASRSAGSKANASVANGVSSGHYAHRETNPIRHVRSEAWSDCGHDAWRNGVVLDPFAGSGTTLAVATGHGRDCIGIDLDERNADLARERVGMFLDVEYPDTEVIA